VLVSGWVGLNPEQARGIDRTVDTTFFRLFSPHAFDGRHSGFVLIHIHNPEVSKLRSFVGDQLAFGIPQDHQPPR
jgi:hypothetical protein